MRVRAAYLSGSVPSLAAAAASHRCASPRHAPAALDNASRGRAVARIPTPSAFRRSENTTRPGRETPASALWARADARATHTTPREVSPPQARRLSAV